MLQFFEALGVRRHARVGVVAGVVLAFALYVFFVALPTVVPGIRGRAESPLLFVVLGFVAAVATALFVATALTVRSLAGAVASFPKWVHRGGTLAALGGLLWTAATLAGAVPVAAVRPWIAVPVLLVLPGVWAAHTRVKRLDRPLDRLGTVLATAGVGAVHVAALLEPEPFLGATVAPVLTPFVASVATLAVGTVALAGSARDELGALADAAVVLAAVGALALAAPLSGSISASGAVAVVPVALAWVALGVALRRSPDPVGWSPGDADDLLDDVA